MSARLRASRESADSAPTHESFAPRSRVSTASSVPATASAQKQLPHARHESHDQLQPSTSRHRVRAHATSASVDSPLSARVPFRSDSHVRARGASSLAATASFSTTAATVTNARSALARLTHVQFSVGSFRRLFPTLSLEDVSCEMSRAIAESGHVASGAHARRQLELVARATQLMHQAVEKKQQWTREKAGAAPSPTLPALPPSAFSPTSTVRLQPARPTRGPSKAAWPSPRSYQQHQQQQQHSHRGTDIWHRESDEKDAVASPLKPHPPPLSAIHSPSHRLAPVDTHARVKAKIRPPEDETSSPDEAASVEEPPMRHHSAYHSDLASALQVATAEMRAELQSFLAQLQSRASLDAQSLRAVVMRALQPSGVEAFDQVGRRIDHTASGAVDALAAAIAPLPDQLARLVDEATREFDDAQQAHEHDRPCTVTPDGNIESCPLTFLPRRLGATVESRLAELHAHARRSGDECAANLRVDLTRAFPALLPRWAPAPQGDVQSSYRGHAARVALRVRSVRPPRTSGARPNYVPSSMHAAAQRIQAAFRGHLVRRAMHTQHRTSFRGHSSRKNQPGPDLDDLTTNEQLSSHGDSGADSIVPSQTVFDDSFRVLAADASMDDTTEVSRFGAPNAPPASVVQPGGAFASSRTSSAESYEMMMTIPSSLEDDAASDDPTASPLSSSLPAPSDSVIDLALREAAATKIQSLSRGYIARQSVSQQRQLQAALFTAASDHVAQNLAAIELDIARQREEDQITESKETVSQNPSDEVPQRTLENAVSEDSAAPIIPAADPVSEAQTTSTPLEPLVPATDGASSQDALTLESTEPSPSLAEDDSSSPLRSSSPHSANARTEEEQHQQEPATSFPSSPSPVDHPSLDSSPVAFAPSPPSDSIPRHASESPRASTHLLSPSPLSPHSVSALVAHSPAQMRLDSPSATPNNLAHAFTLSSPSAPDADETPQDAPDTDPTEATTAAADQTGALQPTHDDVGLNETVLVDSASDANRAEATEEGVDNTLASSLPLPLHQSPSEPTTIHVSIAPSDTASSVVSVQLQPIALPVDSESPLRSDTNSPSHSRASTARSQPAHTDTAAPTEEGATGQPATTPEAAPTVELPRTPLELDESSEGDAGATST